MQYTWSVVDGFGMTEMVKSHVAESGQVSKAKKFARLSMCVCSKTLIIKEQQITAQKLQCGLLNVTPFI